jgi:hypothetical protein
MAIVIDGNNTPTAGGIGYGDGTELAFSAAGTSGQVLQSNGASAPSWITSSPSAMTFISTATASSSASVTFTGLTSTYSSYLFVLSGVIPSSNTQFLRVRTSTNNGSSYDTSGYAYSIVGLNSNNAGYTALGTDSSGNSGTGFINLNIDYLNTTGGGWTGTLFFISPSSAIANKNFTIAGAAPISTTNATSINGFGCSLTTSAVNAVQFYFSSANITSGTFKLYGIS